MMSSMYHASRGILSISYYWIWFVRGQGFYVKLGWKGFWLGHFWNTAQQYPTNFTKLFQLRFWINLAIDYILKRAHQRVRPASAVACTLAISSMQRPATRFHNCASCQTADRHRERCYGRELNASVLRLIITSKQTLGPLIMT